MRQSDKFMLNEGVLLLAYAYAASGYTTASICFGIAAALISVWCHSLKVLYQKRMTILCASILQAVLIRLSGLGELLSVLSLLALCNTVFSLLWMQSSIKAVSAPMGIHLTGMLCSILIVLTLPEDMLSHMAGCDLTFLQAFLLVCLIFMPLSISFLAKQIRHHMLLKRRQSCHIMNHIPKADAYDRMAHQAVRSGQ